MTGVEIVVDENPNHAMRDIIVAPLREYNASQVGPIKPEPLAICLRGDDGAVIGGLWGHTVADWLYVDLLIVPDGMRNQGIGTAVMKKAEEIARKRNCVGVWLCTATFQAPGFYEKLGYSRFGQLPDFPRGHTNFYYSKRLGGC